MLINICTNLGPDEQTVWLLLPCLEVVISSRFCLGPRHQRRRAPSTAVQTADPGPLSVDGVAIGRAITAAELTGTLKRNRDKYRAAADSREASLRQAALFGSKDNGAP